MTQHGILAPPGERTHRSRRSNQQDRTDEVVNVLHPLGAQGVVEMRRARLALPSPAMVVAVVALIAAAGGLASAQSGGRVGDADGVIHACAALNDPLARGIAPRGSLRVVAAGEACADGERQLSFAAPPTIYDVESTVKGLGAQMKPIGAAALPAGDYKVTATATIKAPTGFNEDQSVDCSIVSPAGVLSTASATIAAGEHAPEITIPLAAVVRDMPAGDLSVQCTDTAITPAASTRPATTRAAARSKTGLRARAAEPKVYDPSKLYPGFGKTPEEQRKIAAALSLLAEQLPLPGPGH